MTKKSNFHDEMRGEFAHLFLRRARESVNGSPTLILLRTALATVLMFLLVTGHMLMGPKGIVLVSLLFLAGITAPLWLRTRRQRRPGAEARRTPQAVPGTEISEARGAE